MDLQNQLCKLIFSFSLLHTRVSACAMCTFSSCQGFLLLLLLFFALSLLPFHCLFFSRNRRRKNNVYVQWRRYYYTFKYEPFTVQIELHFIVHFVHHNTFLPNTFDFHKHSAAATATATTTANVQYKSSERR